MKVTNFNFWIGFIALFRITSYNVCYTKLLRVYHPDAVISRTRRPVTRCDGNQHVVQSGQRVDEALRQSGRHLHLGVRLGKRRKQQARGCQYAG